MTIIERVNKRLETYGLTVEDLSEEELADAKECVRTSAIDGFFSSSTLIRKTLEKRIGKKLAY
jgi:hypothetical protein